MRRRIPSTAALVAFEAAARHGSISRAASELAQTEGAISRQIAKLEESLGLLLFTRSKQRIHLTDAGKTYFEQIGQTLDRIEQDTLSLMAQPERKGRLELAVIPTFTNKWLIPRLPDFVRIYPEITINMSDRADPFLFANTPFDAAIHFDDPAWAGTVKHDLFSEDMVPVCAPSLTGGRPIGSAAELDAYPLLHKTTRPEAWRVWSEKAGWELTNSMRGARLDLYSMLVESARAGLGIAIVPRLYAFDQLQQGALIEPLGPSSAGEKRFCLIYPEYKEGFWPLSLFRHWIAQAARHYLAGGEV